MSIWDGHYTDKIQPMFSLTYILLCVKVMMAILYRLENKYNTLTVAVWNASFSQLIRNKQIKDEPVSYIAKMKK